ncbi:snRNA-activating protein complex subunit 1b [Corythoichthys intestinalis]|uniref:snRNA-activating protein complex subunit 1b n=1 Tax=Corythoichthys intestinalis TaxID=161448 RepID=UPI0025A64335|nr:snRNA-activating protein complex subunit 1b [Corythoichthys intestinalis]
MNSVRLNQQVRSDFDELLAPFQQTDSVRFEVFSKIWREKKLGQIFYGTVGCEKRAFSRLVLDMAIGYFMPPFSFQIRVGGLYLIYSLYHCQTASPPVRIRMALKDWDYVLSFEKDALGSQHLDAIFILRQLVFCKAFYFTAMPTLLTFKKTKKGMRTRMSNKFIARACGPQELIDRDAMEELSNVHNLYCKLKSSVYTVEEGKRLGINLTRQNMLAQLRGYVLSYHNWQRRKQEEESEHEENDDCGEGTSSQTESSQRARLLSSIKSKAYGEATEAPKSRRHRQVEVDASDLLGPASPKRPARSAKASLKARTQENLCITGHLKNEVSTTTRIHRLVTLQRCKIEGKKEEK